MVYLFSISVAVLGAIFDFRERRIPNWLTVPALLAGIALNAFLVPGGLRRALLGILIAALIYVPLFALRAIGAGDVKLMAALGAIAGPVNWLAIFLATCIVGGIAACALVLRSKRVLETWFNLGYLVSQLTQLRAPYKNNDSLNVRSTASARLPHGVSIAAGTLLALLTARFWAS